MISEAEPRPPEPSEARASAEETALELARVTRRMLPKVMFWLGVTYGVFALGHQFSLAPDQRIVMVPAALISSVMFFTLAGLWRRETAPLSWAIPSMAFGALWVLANSSLHLWIVPEPAQTTNFLLFLFGLSFLVLSTPWLVALVITAWASWLALVMQAPPSDDWLHFGFALFSDTMIVGLLHLLVVKHLAKLHALHQRDLTVQARLEHALEKAQEAARAKDAFLAAMSHELRTPLNSILGFSQLIGRKEGSLTSRQQEYLDTIHRNGRHLLSLIDRVLDLSRIESGHLDLIKVDVDLPSLVLEVVQDQSLSAERKGLSLTLEPMDFVEPDGQRLQTDPERLRQVVINLVANGVKFTKHGSVVLRFKTSGGRIVALEVSDTGPGISQQDQHLIFDRFVQAEAGIARLHEGTGLGLTISRQLCRGMGYELSVRSELGSGSTFIVDFAADPDRS